jgi:hypothetical protein
MCFAVLVDQTNKGNPFAAEMAKYRVELYRSITPDNVASIARAQIEKADKGDTKSATLIFSLLGLLVKQIEENVTSTELTPEEAQTRVAKFLTR